MSQHRESTKVKTRFRNSKATQRNPYLYDMIEDQISAKVVRESIHVIEKELSQTKALIDIAKPLDRIDEH